MSLDQFRLPLIIVITLISGIGDSQGFTHAANMWHDGKLVPREFFLSALGFGVGIGSYWIAIKYLNEYGVVAPETQTLIWFGVTIIGVALISRKFWEWQTLDQVIAVLVAIGVCWLFYRTGG